MKYLIPIILLLISACGGGGGSSEVEPTPPPIVIESPKLYSYTVTNDADSRVYAGNGVKVNGIIYVSPTTIADSDFVVSGEIIGNEVRLFSYKTRGLVVSFTDGDNSGLHLNLEELWDLNAHSLSDLNGEWFNLASSGMFGEPIVTLVYDNGQITGTDTDGCNITGEAFESDDVIGIELTLTDCAQSGDYHGSLRVEGDKIIGAVSSNDNGFSLLYTKG